MKKKFLALVLTLAMVLSLVPMTALATGDNQVDTVAAGSQSASEGANGGSQESDSKADSGSTPTGGTTTGGTPETGTEGSGSTSSGGGTGGGSTTKPTEPATPKNVAKIGNNEYETLDEAIAEAENNQTIQLLKDFSLESGITVENKTLTIQGDGQDKQTITLKGLGIHADKSNLTFKDCGLEITANDNHGHGGTANLISNSNLTFDNVKLTISSELEGQGSGLYLYQESNLYLTNYSVAKVSGYNAKKASGIYADNSEYDGMPNRNIKVSNHAVLTISDCDWHGMTINPIDLTIDGYSKIDISECGNEGYGGGLGCYYGKLTISDHSSLYTNYNNGSAWGTFVKELSIDGTSDLSSCNNLGNGLNIGGKGEIVNGSTLIIEGNQKAGLVSYTGSNYWYGNVNIEQGANVEIHKNNQGIYVQPGGKLNMQDGNVTHNGGASYGGGLRNLGGTVVLGGEAAVYNNHAATAGDDIYNTGKITFGDVGEGWVLDDCNHAITGWYDDGENARWCADTLPRHLKEYAPESGETHQLALKAAHGVDPVPLPEPKLETPEIDKTATPLNQDKSTVTLTVGGSEEKANIAVMFLLDKSTSQTKARQNAAEMLWNLKEKTNTNIIYDVVIFSGTATSTGWRNIADDETRQDSIAHFANGKTTSGTNMTAGIDQAKKDMKTLSERYPEYKDSTFLVTISDGVSYYWDENGVTKCVPIAAWNGNETVFETAPKSDVSTWEMMYSAGTSLKDVYGGVSQFLAIIPDKMQATRDKNYVRNYEGDSTDLENPLTTYIYNPTKKQTVADTYASAAEFSMYYSIQGYADLVKSFARVYTLPMPEVNTDGSETETWTKYYPWGREVMLYLQDYSTNAGAGIFHDADSEEIFQEIKDEILYSIQSGVVTDIIGKNFDLTDRNKLTENTFTLKVGGVTLDATVDASNDKVVYFGAADENGMYPYEVKYQPASTDKEEQLIWIINKPVERSKRLTLSYSLDLINKKTASGTYTEPTNENAVLDYVTTTNEEGQLIFPVPTVSYTVSGGGGSSGGGTITIPDDVPTGLDLKNHYGYIIGYPVDYYTGKPTTDQTKKPVRPEGKITRAEVATIYFRMLTDENRAANWNQVSGFSDVKSSAWYNNAISTLTKAGILKGYEDGTFQPNGYITRAEFATIAIRFFSGVYEGEDLFPDIKGHWAEDYINNAANKGLVKGYEDGTFGPDRYITRAEAVTLVNRTLNRHPHNDGLHQDMLRWPDNMDTSKWYYADMQEATNSHEPDKNKSTADKEYWGKMLPIRDWEALEKEWSNANSAPGEGEVV